MLALEDDEDWSKVQEITLCAAFLACLSNYFTEIV
jgi:hypothetical protein